MNFHIPFFSLKRQWENIKSKVSPSINSLLDSQQYIGGEFVSRFEKKLSKFLNAEYVIGCNSGTDALWLALRTLKTPKNSIVLTTPFSFIASCSEIIDHSAHPVFIDIEKDSFNISADLLNSWLNENGTMVNGAAVHKKTKMPIVGMIVVNIFGQCANYEKLRKIANEWNLWIIEDAAQSIGSNIDQRQSGTFGDIACFSFYPTKNLGAFGDAGAVVTNNKNLSDTLLMLRHHGRIGSTGYNYQEYGVNSRLDAIQAAILSEKLDFLDSWNKKRIEIAKIYESKLSNLEGITTPKQVNGEHVYHQYSILIDENLRDEFAKFLASKNIGTNIFYPKPFTEIPFLNQSSEIFNDCPLASSISKKIISLPIWPELQKEEIDYICEQVAYFINAHNKIKLNQTPQNMVL